MIASGYTMDVYCDSEGACKGNTVYGAAKDSYYGESWGEVVRMARKEGWKITSNREAYCPWCTGKKKRTKEDTST